MELILDTCGLLSLSGFADKDISAATLHIIGEGDTLFISDCSLFELAIKHKKGVLPLGGFSNAHEYWQAAITQYNITPIPVSSNTFYHSTTLPDYHQDPFDRIIISEAITAKIGIVTYDTVFKKYGVPLYN